MLTIFDQRNILALDHYDKQWGMGTGGTCTFINTILKLWKMVNNKHPYKHIRLRDPDSKPIETLQDLSFMKDCLERLNTWKACKLKQRKGCLLNETWCSFTHTLTGRMDVCKYLLEERELSYVLLGKFQTDNLEFRFSQYRQMGRCNFHISVQQILEGEKKLKLLSMLKTISAELLR